MTKNAINYPHISLEIHQTIVLRKKRPDYELAMWLVFSLLRLSVKKRQIDAKKSIDRFFQKGLRFFYAVPLFENLQAVF